MDVVDRSLVAREETIQLLKYNLSKARNRMKQQADKHRTERDFQVGKWVYLKLQPYRQTSIDERPNQKLATRYSGPFLILAKVGKVAYTLKLPPGATMHPTFHVSLLKKHHGAAPEIVPSFTVGTESLRWVPEAVIDKRIVQKYNHAVTKWRGKPTEDSTWEVVQGIEERFPKFDPWGQGSSEGDNDTNLSSI